MIEKKNEDEIKIILLGHTGVGKTNLIYGFIGAEFQENSEANVASSFEGEIAYENKSYIYTIWDTAGQEKYKAINKIFLRNANIILIIYSIIDRQSFNEINYWINYVKENLEEDKYIMALVANKSDLYEQQLVNEEEGEEVAKKYGIEFKKTSALTCADSFRNFVNGLVINYIEMSKGSGNKKENIKLNKKGKSKKKCC